MGNFSSRRRGEVQRSGDFYRISNLPRREWVDNPEYTERLSAVLRKDPNARLLPAQAQALTELVQCQGLLGSIGCGAGKTLTTLLAPVVLGVSRALLVLPSALREKTISELPLYRAQWHIPAHVDILSYEQFSRDASALDVLLPELLLFDEAHRVKSHSRARTRRINEWIRKRRGDGHRLIIAALTGSMTNRSVLEYAHLADWALQDGSPAPRLRAIAGEWAAALDEKVDPESRLRPGALLDWALPEDLEDEEAGDLSIARAVYRRRFVATPGVVVTEDTFTATPLIITTRDIEFPASAKERTEKCLPCEGTGEDVDGRECLYCKGQGRHVFEDSVDGYFRQLRLLKQTPDGIPIPDQGGLWRHARTLGCEFYYRLNPPPPQEWTVARSNWFSYVQDRLSRNIHGLCSMRDVARADSQNAYLLAWNAIRKSYDPDEHREAVWLGATVLTYAARWAKEAPGVVWVEHIAFGERLSQITGMPYCSSQGADARGVQAIDQDPRRSFIASIKSIGEGQNLQAWPRNLVISAEPNGKVWEQMLSRCHRTGQTKPVTFEVLLTSIEAWCGFEQARADSLHANSTVMGPQKLQVADLHVILPGRGPRWEK